MNNKITERRKKLGLTQQQLADKMNTDIRWIQKIEAGDINIENITFIKAIDLIKALTDENQNDDIEDWNLIKSAYFIVKLLLKKENS